MKLVLSACAVAAVVLTALPPATATSDPIPVRDLTGKPMAKEIKRKTLKYCRSGWSDEGVTKLRYTGGAGGYWMKFSETTRESYVYGNVHYRLDNRGQDGQLYCADGDKFIFPSARDYDPGPGRALLGMAGYNLHLVKGGTYEITANAVVASGAGVAAIQMRVYDKRKSTAWQSLDRTMVAAYGHAHVAAGRFNVRTGKVWGQFRAIDTDGNVVPKEGWNTFRIKLPKLKTGQRTYHRIVRRGDARLIRMGASG